MSPVEEYFDTLAPEVRREFERIRATVRRLVPDAEEGRSYAMPAYLYKGKGLLAAMANKNFLSLYPFSGRTVAALKERLEGFETTSGSIHFSLEHPLPESLLEEIVAARMAEIERRA